MKVRVWYNVDGSPIEFNALADHEVVAEFKIDGWVLDDELNTLGFLEKLYRSFQGVDGTEVVGALEIRSMSMGDIVEFVWACDRCKYTTKYVGKEPCTYCEGDGQKSESWYVDVVGFAKTMTPRDDWGQAFIHPRS